MSFAFASCNEYGIVISADRCITGTSSNGIEFTETSFGEKLFLTSQGYGITFTGCASVDGYPVPAKIRCILKELTGDMTIIELFEQFVLQMADFSKANIIFIAAGYLSGKPTILTATTQNPTVRIMSNICYSGGDGLAENLLQMIPVVYNTMTLQDRINFHRFITRTIATFQYYSDTIQTVSEACDIAAIGQAGVLFSSFSELH